MIVCPKCKKRCIPSTCSIFLPAWLDCQVEDGKIIEGYDYVDGPDPTDESPVRCSDCKMISPRRDWGIEE